MTDLLKIIVSLEKDNKDKESKIIYMKKEVIYLEGIVKTFQILCGILTTLFIIAAISAVI